MGRDHVSALEHHSDIFPFCKALSVHCLGLPTLCRKPRKDHVVGTLAFELSPGIIIKNFLSFWVDERGQIFFPSKRSRRCGGKHLLQRFELKGKLPRRPYGIVDSLSEPLDQSSAPFNRTVWLPTNETSLAFDSSSIMQGRRIPFSQSSWKS